ncbi:hypothetical protein BCR42DRAFT_415862 [Absidia repens]|uniref:F-box/LRR-repeat protein 15-like leucin rich repeat domain-containing protein n=1 Tax=Absidia repens TaxID=90262 RepID=A0A1X2IHE2_9FUNG|nr:hypothetical protein BCR42DRAFT_415862 [Absidia repens]
MNSLASEILHVITDLLQDDQQTLTQLTFVSKALHDVTTPYLYKSPSILTFHQLTRFSRFLTSRHYDCIKTINLQLIPHRWQHNIGQVLESILQRTHNLERLDLGFCNLDPRRIVSAIAHCEALQYLSLNGVRNVTDQVVLAFVQDHPHLIELDISSAVITDSSVYAISRYCPSLEELDISGCEHISEDGIRFLTQQCKHLRYINIKDCYNVIPEDGEFDGLPTTTDDIWETDEEYVSDIGDVQGSH